MPGARHGAHPLSFAQERLWFFDQYHPDSPAYNLPLALHLAGPLDVTALARSLDALVRRHDTLRAAFAAVDGTPVQVVAPAPPAPELVVALPLVDLHALVVPEREAEIRRLIAQEARRLFDLKQGPLLRATLLRLTLHEHVLLLTLHHIATDGWSKGVLARELGALYAAFATGQSSPLPDLPIQYADYARWQRAWLQGDALDACLAYWRARLKDAPVVLELPADRPRPPVQTFAGAAQTIRLPETLTTELKLLSRREGATLFMTLLAAFQVLLGRYSGQEDVLVGAPMAGRSVVECDDLIGFFVNTLVLRGDLSGDPSFTELLARTRAVTLDAFAHADAPFEQIVQDLHPHRDPSRQPLVQVLFNMLNVARDEFALPGLTVDELATSESLATFDLTLSVEERREGVELRVVYNTDLFDTATIERLAGHYRTLLEGVVAEPDRPLSALPLLTDVERRQLLVDWNDTRTDYPRDACIHELFAAQAARTPDAIAVVYADERLTYRALDGRANRLAHHLRRLGVGPETMVGLCVERSPEMVVGLLGIIKAGGACVPLDPSYPPERLAFMLRDARAPLLVTHAHLVGRLPSYSGLTIRLDMDVIDAASTDAERPPEDGATADDSAYVVYTSGSTGTPKGVPMRRRALVNLVTWQLRQGCQAPGLRTLQYAPLSFDVSFQEMCSTLCTGGTLLLIGEDLRRDAVDLLRFLDDARAERIFLPVVALQQLAEAAGDGGAVPAHLCEVITAGEQLRITPEIVRLFERLPGCTLHNHYGPSESHVVTAYTLDSAPGGWSALPPIGRPIANTRVYILDGSLHPVPIGVSGELYIGGDGLARGYLNRPELTAERFIPHPFSDDPSDRLYKTGDLARYRSDGAIEFLGRRDHQVKIRGYRIEIGEIEAALARHPAVREAVVVAREDTLGDKRLAAYVVPASGEALATSDLRSFLATSLPAYMLPATFVLLDALPLTPSGKLDRRALPAPDQTALAVAERFVAPRTPTEELLAAIWADVLGVARVGTDDSFFDLGGHSLLATRVLARLRDAFSVELPMRALFEAPTLAALALRVETARGTEVASLPALVAGPRHGAHPLSFAQERLWFFDQYHPDSPAYNLPLALHLAGSLDVTALARSLDALMRRHDALRTTFAAVDGEPVQVVAPAPPAPELVVALPLVDLHALVVPEREAEIRRLIAQEARRLFDLKQGPLLRATLLRLTLHEHVLLLTLHHIATDGWSMDVLARELGAFYAAFAAGRPSPLPDLPIQYADYARWQRAWLQGDALDARLAYWRARLKDAPLVLELPTDRPRPPVQTFAGATQTVLLSETLTTELKLLSRREGVTLFMTLLAAFQILLGRYSGQEDVLVGAPIAGRSVAECDELIGFFVNTLVLRGDLSGDPSFTELLARTRAVTLDAFAHADAPFEQIVQDLHPHRDPSRQPLVQVLFNMLNVAHTEFALPELTVEELAPSESLAKFDLTLSVTEAPGGLRAHVEYNTDLFDTATIERLTGHFRTLLEGVVAEPNRPLSALPLLTDVERRQLLVDWNDTRTDYPRDACIHALFAAQAARTPDAVAVVYEDHQLTYRELDERANQLAHYLRRRGVGPDVLVGICMERSVELVVGLLGILKAGGAYLPLDPTYPRERLAFMVEDSQTPVLLTQERLRDRLPATAARVLCLDAAWPAMMEERSDAPHDAGGAGNLAYVIYTSGSTGRPKGVCIEHRSVVRLVKGTTYVDVTARDVFVQLAPLSFDAATFELWGSLLNGARLALAPPHMPSLEELSRLLRRHRVTILWLTAPLFHQVVDERPDCLRGVRQLLAGGDVLSASHVRTALQALGDSRVINGYGPTENTTFTCCYPLTVASDIDASVPIGRPIANTRVYILDAHLQPVPIGVPGELHIGGDGLARGYLNRPELTAERFIPDPFSDDSTARLYKTGDLARYRPDGNIEFLGRRDHQVKIRGYRIELGEIEAALARHPAVREAVVVAREDTPGDKRLVAYVVPQGEAPLTPADLRPFLVASLPAYMLPAAFVLLDRLPLTPTGKLDRRALPAPDQTDLAVAERFVAPRTPTEELLAAIWADVLGIERVGADDNFFDLGGHSLLATRVVSRVYAALRVEAPLLALFRAATLADFATEIADIVQSQGQPNTDTTISVPPGALTHHAAERLLTEMDTLSNTDVDALLDRLLRG